MAMTKTYHTVNGRIIGETSAGVRTDYLTDALGSVTATVNQAGAVVNRYRYKPYGALLSKSGAGADPKQQWVGSLGYRQTGKKYSDVYVRARHYDTANGRWTSKDPLRNKWGTNSFTYVAGRPFRFVDPSGTIEVDASCQKLGPCECGQRRVDILKLALDNIQFNSKLFDLTLADWRDILVCARNQIEEPCASRGNPAVSALILKVCLTGYFTNKPKPVKVLCKSDQEFYCQFPQPNCSYSLSPCIGGSGLVPSDFVICADTAIPCKDPASTMAWSKNCRCGFYKTSCRRSFPNLPEPECNLLHEMIHACGFCRWSVNPLVFGSAACLESWTDAVACCVSNTIFA